MTEASQDWLLLLQNHLARAKRPLIVILGPTASGKTAFSLKVAETLRKMGKRAEIVNADSRQLYRHLDIGTAKITEEEMEGVPHHLLSCLDPKEPVTIHWYQKEARGVIDEIHAPDTQIFRYSGIPILVGGSMLYISAIIDGLTPSKPVSPELRQKLEAEYDADKGKTLFVRLQKLDPEGSAGIDPRNKRYVVRAMEILESSTAAFSSAKKRTPVAYDALIFGIERSREELHRRVEERTKQLLSAGWIEEVWSLLANGYTASDPGLESTGYREIIAYLEGRIASREALEQMITAKTRQYARRQMTWWRGDGRIHWVNNRITN